ncbi:TetR/AcrR family transcriptional regulator [Streptomyces sp. NPDC001002]
MTAEPRSTRSRPAKAPLGRGVVIDAALGILRTEGAQALTMRRVAERLDTGPASLYVYVDNRDDLLCQALDAVLAAVPMEPVDPERWRVQLEELLRATVRAMSDHPGIAQVSLGRIPTGPASLALNERIATLLLAGGISQRTAAWACDLLGLYAAAVAFEADGRALDEAQAERRRSSGVADVVERLPAERFPVLAALSGHLMQGTAEERFAFALEVVVDGLLARE